MVGIGKQHLKPDILEFPWRHPLHRAPGSNRKKSGRFDIAAGRPDYAGSCPRRRISIDYFELKRHLKVSLPFGKLKKQASPRLRKRYPLITAAWYASITRPVPAQAQTRASRLDLGIGKWGRRQSTS